MRKESKATALWQEHTPEGKITLARQLTDIEFLLLDDRGDLRCQTAAFPPAQLSLLRNRRQAFIRHDMAVFAQLTIRELEQDDRVLGWLIADCPANHAISRQ